MVGKRQARAEAQMDPPPAFQPLYKAPPVGACTNTALRKATRRISQLYDTVIAPCGLKNTQRSILVHIARMGEPTMGELADSLVLDRSALAQNLKPLERDGLVRVVVCANDKRSRRVALTEAGDRKLASSAHLWEQAQRQFEAAFVGGEGSAQGLREILNGIASETFAKAFERGEGERR